MQIYLAKPGGEKKGPFTLDEINRDLVAKIYREDSYWAWYEVLSDWLPLYAVPGIYINGPPNREPALPPVPRVKPPGIQQVTGLLKRAGLDPEAILNPPPRDEPRPKLTPAKM